MFCSKLSKATANIGKFKANQRLKITVPSHKCAFFHTYDLCDIVKYITFTYDLADSFLRKLVDPGIYMFNIQR